MMHGEYKIFNTAHEVLEFVKKFEATTSNKYCHDICSHTFWDEMWRPNIVEKMRLYWKNDQAKIPFDGVPFIFGGVKAWRCHLGPDLCKRKKEKYRQDRDRRELEGQFRVKRRIPPETKKLGCPAMIHAHRLAKFPDFRVRNEDELTKRTRDRLKRQVVEAAASKAGIRIEMTYLLRLPLPTHHNHPIPYKSVRSRGGMGRVRVGQLPRDWSEPLLTAVTKLVDADFLQTFRVTKHLFQLLTEEWHKEEELVKRKKECEDEVDISEAAFEQSRVGVLAALYYLGSLEALERAAERFCMIPDDFLATVTKFYKFIARQQEKYITLPTLEERLVIGEGFKRVSGFPGVMGALDAVTIPLTPKQVTPTVKSSPVATSVHCHQSDLYPASSPLPSNSKHHHLSDAHSLASPPSALVLQYISDHTLVFRDIHLALLSTPGHTCLQIFQESRGWEWLACLTSCETHVVASSAYPLAPAIMTPHLKDILLYQEALYNENHMEARRVGWRAISLFRSRFRRIWHSWKDDQAWEIKESTVKGGRGVKRESRGRGAGGKEPESGVGEVVVNIRCGRRRENRGIKLEEKGEKSRGRVSRNEEGEMQQEASAALLLVQAACVLYNMAVMNEPQSVLDTFLADQSEAVQVEMCGQEGKEEEGREGGVADFGLLGGEEKRHYLTTVMTDRFDGSLPDLEMAGGFGS